jgi:hypothetical protein
MKFHLKVHELHESSCVMDLIMALIEVKVSKGFRIGETSGKPCSLKSQLATHTFCRCISRRSGIGEKEERQREKASAVQAQHCSKRVYMSGGSRQKPAAKTRVDETSSQSVETVSPASGGKENKMPKVPWACGSHETEPKLTFSAYVRETDVSKCVCQQR